MKIFETYSSIRLKRKLDSLNLKGRKITVISSPSAVDWFEKEDYSLIVDKNCPDFILTSRGGEIVFTFDDDRRIGIFNCAASHFVINEYETNDVISEPINTNSKYPNVSKIFSDIVEKTIIDFYVYINESPEELDMALGMTAWFDEGFDFNSKSYISELFLKLNDGTSIRIRSWADYCTLEYSTIWCNVEF